MLTFVVISIPISLLWNVRIKPRQKLGIGAFLCLSIVMIILSIIKIAFIRTSVDSFDLVWQIFWQQVQASAAVLMVSMNAFRSIFVSNKPSPGGSANRSGILHRFQSWLSSKKKREDGDAEHPHHLTHSPHLTLGTMFRSNQRKGLWPTQLHSMSTSTTAITLQDRQSGSWADTEDWQVPRNKCMGTKVSTVAACGHELTKDACYV